MFQTTQNDVFVKHTKLAKFANHYSLYCGDRIGLGVEVYRNDGSIHLPVTPEMQVEILTQVIIEIETRFTELKQDLLELQMRIIN